VTSIGQDSRIGSIETGKDRKFYMRRKKIEQRTRNYIMGNKNKEKTGEYNRKGKTGQDNMYISKRMTRLNRSPLGKGKGRKRKENI
jgi:hypothetical protein